METRKLLWVTVYYLVPASTKAVIFCLFLGDQCTVSFNMGPLMSPITLTWVKLLASILSIPGVWETPTQKKTMSEASAEAGRVLGMVGEIWTIVQVLRLLRATQYSIRVSVCLFRWIPAATRSNDIYLQVTFIRPFIAYQDSFLALQPSCVLSLSCSSYLFWDWSVFPRSAMDCSKLCVVPWMGIAGVSASLSRCWGQTEASQLSFLQRIWANVARSEPSKTWA